MRMSSKIRLRSSYLTIFLVKPSWENSRVIQSSEGYLSVEIFVELR